MDFIKEVTVTPGFDKTNSDPAKNYGVGACRIFFYLKKNGKAVTFQIGTDWYPFHVQDRFRDRDTFNKYQPQGWDVGYHSPHPMYENHFALQNSCEIIGGVPCYYDGSALRADDWVEPFILGGTEWLWKRLEEEFYERFPEELDNNTNNSKG